MFIIQYHEVLASVYTHKISFDAYGDGKILIIDEKVSFPLV